MRIDVQCKDDTCNTTGGLQDLGSIEPGKLADILVLNKDPLENIRNTEKINALVIHGRLLDRTALDNQLAQATTFAAQ